MSVYFLHTDFGKLTVFINVALQGLLMHVFPYHKVTMDYYVAT